MEMHPEIDFVNRLLKRSNQAKTPLLPLPNSIGWEKFRL